MMKWMTRFQPMFQRLMNSWLDILDPVMQEDTYKQTQGDHHTVTRESCGIVDLPRRQVPPQLKKFC